MEIIKMNEIEGRTNKRGVTAKKILKHEHAQIMNLVLNPGDVVPEHSVPVDVFFYIVEGKGRLQIGDEAKVVEAKDIIPCPANTEMSLKADQDEEFVVLNVKTPSL
ncbi:MULTISPECIES: cupin domain-containing protein [unclassified Candidatus Frackibacter]|uniref:cupin domain-containing protein n=1 Tax=unclassified Candidatus Frackibacter TaxID=2648818 RepID=UPI000797A633|nr:MULTISPECIES: cupin domain-containing protein [unclassified Candidatus Frackibacter]KXS45132.1 MAG: cupin [Candidatus Frackibacter sp. T328-2]SDC47645.1 Cupin domain-containing protein [Candidatus Frackibacter sp. WG11]SEM81094.1 Cupin domain-containing protein [Candidatus Frackibacter sp. WG12]SFL72944.1 Cupin domain-containing protein [Candidatus Frackibacter sp. WG13]